MTETEIIADVIAEVVKTATAPLLTKCADLEAQVKALEARAPVPGPPGPQGERGERGEPGEPGLSGQDGPSGPAGRDGVNGKDAPAVDFEEVARRAAALVPAGKDGAPGRDGVDGKDAPSIDIDDVARRAAALVPAGKDGAPGRDGRDGAQGLPGRDGAPGERGEKGLDGKDGTNGTVDDLRLKLVPVTERSFQLYAGDGVPVEGGLITFDFPLYKGVYSAGTNYTKGDCVTFGGSLWIARDETAEKPGDGATRWQLAVKKGSDGREGKPGKDGERGPKGERGDPGRNFS